MRGLQGLRRQTSGAQHRGSPLPWSMTGAGGEGSASKPAGKLPYICLLLYIDYHPVQALAYAATDLRRRRRLGNPRLDTIFPGYTGYTPLGVVAGEDLPLTDIFSDGFESGDLSAWSSST